VEAEDEGEGMYDLAGICIFITIMTALSIPIIAILKHRPRNPKYEERLEELERRLQAMERENSARTMEIEILRKDQAFTNKLLENKK
jgi:hypothetical protein